MSAWVGTWSRPPNSAAASARVCGCSATTRVPLSRLEPGLVEGDVAVVSEAEDGEVDGRLVEPPLVAVALGSRIGGRAVEAVERADRDAARAHARR